MKLLLDENVPEKLAELLVDVCDHVAHVFELGLASADDGVVWTFAAANGYAIVSKDKDFKVRSVLRGAPPKVIWLRVGNCSVDDINLLVRSDLERIKSFLDELGENCLELSRS